MTAKSNPASSARATSRTSCFGPACSHIIVYPIKAMIVPLRLGRLHPREERELAPLPVALDVHETDLAQPGQLRLDGDKLVRRVVLGRRLADRGEEGDVELRRGGVDVLEVQEAPARLEQLEHLPVQRPLALIDAVMDREARDDE